MTGSELEDARYLGGLEQRVRAAEERLLALETRLTEHHSLVIAKLNSLQGTMDRQTGGLQVLRWLGAGMVGLSGWLTLWFGVWKK